MLSLYHICPIPTICRGTLRGDLSRILYDLSRKGKIDLNNFKILSTFFLDTL